METQISKDLLTAQLSVIIVILFCILIVLLLGFMFKK